MMKSFGNPIIPNSAKGNTWDPYVLRYGGCYYHCYSNAQGVYVTRSETLWDIGKGETIQVYDCTKEGALCEWFAPELHHINGKWYIYASPDYGGWMHTMTVLVGEGDTPMCLYRNGGAIGGLEGKWTIDGTVMIHQGQLYFIWSDCSALYLAQMSDPCRITGEIITLSRPEYPFETKIGPVIEGPALLYRNGKIHIVYSANDSKYDEYCLGLLTFDGGQDIMDASHWIKTDHAVFEKTDKIFGPGHCSFTTVTENGREVDYIVYHANLVSGSGWSGRNVFIQPFDWNEHDLPVFGKPEF